MIGKGEEVDTQALFGPVISQIYLSGRTLTIFFLLGAVIDHGVVNSHCGTFLALRSRA